MLNCHVTLAMKFRVPDSMQEKVSTLQNEEQFCKLSKLIENNLQLFLNANVDHHFVWYTLSRNTLHCGDTLTALKYLEEAFILGLTTQHALS